jgi:hypothetical protein
MVTRGLPFSNTLLTDGIDTTNGYSFEKPRIAREISQDAVEDFQVLAWRARSHSLNESKEPSVLKPSTC